jgi:hypothetical protein
MILLLFVNILVLISRSAVAQGSQSHSGPYLTVEPQNITFGPGPAVGQEFTITVMLHNVTTANVPAGLAGLEFWLGWDSTLIQPVNFTDMLGQPGGVLAGPESSLLYITSAGFYLADGFTKVSSPPYSNAVQYEVAAASTCGCMGWWGNGIAAEITFQVVSQPPSPTNSTVGFIFTDLADRNTGPVAVDSENGYVSILPQSPTSVFCSPNPASIFHNVTCTATVSRVNPTGTITWSTSSVGGSFGQSVCTLSNRTCSTTYIDNLTGCVTIAASYSGDSNNTPSSGSTSLTVTSSGPVYYSQNYTSVQAAINAAPSGANVIIAPGFYGESLTINKTLTIIGEKDPPVYGGGASSIYLTLGSGASGSTVTGIEITNVPEGILVDNASNCRIYGNIMASIGSSGIVLEGNNATDNIIFDNIFQDTPTPINLTASASGNIIYGNIITSQTSVTLNIGADGNVVYGNSMSGNQILLNMTNSNANIFYHNNFLATAQLTVLATGNSTWDNGYPSGGNYWSDYLKKHPNAAEIDSSGIWNIPYPVDSNNTDHYPLLKPWTVASGHCVAVISVVAAKTVIAQGFNCSLTVCAADNGEYAESFSVTAYANAMGIGSQQVSGLNASCGMVLRFAWNTASLVYGNYTVSAYAQPVAGQTDMSGNGFTLGTVKVTIPGDINGDFKVSLSDLSLLAKAYGTTPASPKWNPNADINSDGKVSLSDLSLLAKHYGQHYP